MRFAWADRQGVFGGVGRIFGVETHGVRCSLRPVGRELAVLGSGQVDHSNDRTLR